MMVRRLLLAFLILFTTAASAHADETPFAVGQIWTLSDPRYPDARVRIGRIEADGQTIHISLWGAPAPSPDVAAVTGPYLTAGHLPITDEALRASVRAIVDEEAPPLQFEAGYAAWREANGGVFTITVPEIVAVLAEMVRGRS